MSRFFVRTFGCQMNKHDSERITGLLINKGYEKVDNPEKAEIVIFNTCCVRQHAEERLFGNVNSLKPLKKKRKDLVIAVGGCLAQNYKDKLFLLLPHIDLVFGTHNVHRLPGLIDNVRINKNQICEIQESTEILPTKLPTERESKLFAWLPVSIGCNNYCSYCVVPYVRGREISVPMEEVIKEANRFVLQGAREITLLGQNVNSYGHDLYGESRFGTLLEELDGIERLKRIRFTTSHPKDLNNEIIRAVSDCNSACEHIHLPLQAGSSKILKLMNRGYSKSQYIEIIERIKSKIPNCSITTDIMVGFPGETEADFKETLDVIKTVRFDQSFMFIYSPRKGTPAADLANQVPKEEKADRFQRLVALQDQISWEENKKLVGRRFEIFAEGISKKDNNKLFGRTRTNKVVNFASAPEMLGCFLEVEISRASKKSLLGKLV